MSGSKRFERKARLYLLALLILVPAFTSLGVKPAQLEAVQLRGLRFACDGAGPAYTLFSPLSSKTIYLIDFSGRVVRTWTSAFPTHGWVRFLENGHILRGGNDPGVSGYSGGGQGGRLQEFDFDGNLLWDFSLNRERLPHHDAAILPNGNILTIVWEAKTPDEARRMGRREAFIPRNGIWPEVLIEFEPQPPDGARIVWEWHLWDHIIQNTDSTLNNYGDPSLHPERIDVNGDTFGPRVIGPRASGDVYHANAVAYNPEFDQILLSVPTFNEVWILDHSTTTEEAAGHSAGRSGKGGDLLYRWGNPQLYGRGNSGNRLLGFQHDAHWIPPGRPGAGHIIIFSNRTPTAGGDLSKVYELAPPVDAQGRYELPSTGPFGPAAAVWAYSDRDSLQATMLSGAERLDNGNTFISSGPQGRLFEVTPKGEIVWEYWSPYSTETNGFALFRAIRIPASHPALKGRNLQPLDPQPQVNAAVRHGWGKCPNDSDTSVDPGGSLR